MSRENLGRRIRSNSFAFRRVFMRVRGQRGQCPAIRYVKAGQSTTGPKIASPPQCCMKQSMLLSTHWFLYIYVHDEDIFISKCLTHKCLAAITWSENNNGISGQKVRRRRWAEAEGMQDARAIQQGVKDKSKIRFK